MIIIKEASKDAYITNLKTKNNDASSSNTGKSPTLDIFKLYNENDYAYSKLFCKIHPEQLVEGAFFELQDFNEIKIKFTITFLTQDNTATNFDGQGNILIGLKDLQFEQYASYISTTINNVFSRGLLLITSQSNENNDLILKQEIQGNLGDKEVILCQGIESLTGESFFSRIEFSFGLISFNLEDIKTKFIKLNENNEILENSAFKNIKAYIELFDISTGIVKPRDYKLKLYSLEKEFNEGVGKDIINFSDNDVCNFIYLNKNENLVINEYLSKDIDILDFNQNSEQYFNGDENLKIDVSDVVNDYLIGLRNNVNFVLGLHDDYLFDKYTYFVKRFGTRHLNNKLLVPKLKLLIDDTNYIVQENVDNIIRETNIEYKMFLFNKELVETDEVTLNIKNLNGDLIKSYEVDKQNKLYDITGIEIKNSLYQKIKILNEDIPNINLQDENVLFFEWNINNNIVSKQTMFFIINKNISNNILSSNINVVVKNINELNSESDFNNFDVYFFDVDKKNNAYRAKIRTKTDFNDKDVFYSLLDKNSDEIIIDFNEELNSTKLSCDDEKFKLRLNIPSIFKNMNVYFKFKIKSNQGDTIITSDSVFKVK